MNPPVTGATFPDDPLARCLLWGRLNPSGVPVAASASRSRRAGIAYGRFGFGSGIAAELGLLAIVGIGSAATRSIS